VAYEIKPVMTRLQKTLLGIVGFLALSLCALKYF
jgi:hypothetical protein